MRSDEDARRERESRERELHRKRLEQVEQVTGLATLQRLNQTQIEQYHRIATNQADKSFRSSQNAAWTGLVLIIVCIALGITVHVDQVRWFLGGIGAVGAALSGYLNRTYLSMYRDSLSQFNRFFDQPVLTSYFLTAERLASEAGDGSDEMKREIIRQILQTSSQLAGASQPAGKQAAKGKNAGKSKTSGLNGQSRKLGSTVPAQDNSSD